MNENPAEGGRQVTNRPLFGCKWPRVPPRRAIEWRAYLAGWLGLTVEGAAGCLR
jgi:hypothetical protein